MPIFTLHIMLFYFVQLFRNMQGDKHNCNLFANSQKFMAVEIGKDNNDGESWVSCPKRLPHSISSPENA